ncbi:MAG: dihydropteroate synthase, partial [Pseudomonadota bacterium]
GADRTWRGANAAAAQGANIIRAHDVRETRVALAVWSAATGLWDV